MKTWKMLLWFPVILAGCVTPHPPSGDAQLLGVFRGVLPCADCPGIETELTLYHAGPYVDEGTYSLKLTYRDRAVQPYVSRGDWTMIRGDAKDENASVYQLDPDHPEKSLYYLRVHPNELRQLGRNLKEMGSPLHFTLKRVSPALPGD